MERVGDAMNVDGLTTSMNTRITPGVRAGVHRTKPLTTALCSSSNQTNTALPKSTIHTRLSPVDLQGDHAKHHGGVDHAKLVKQAQTLVGQTFFGTLMKQMRDSPFRSDLMDGGRGGQAFGALYDQQLAERMARGAGTHLVNAIVHRLEARANAVRQQVAQARRAA